MNSFQKTSIVLMLCTSILSAQSDTTHLIKSVEIKSMNKTFDRVRYANDVYTSNALQNQMSDMYIKNYGIGQLSTLSVRGLGAENVTVAWEGIPLNSSMNGLMDLNLLPNSLLQNTSYAMNDNRLTSGGILNLTNKQLSKTTYSIGSMMYLSSLFSHKFDAQWVIGKSNLTLITQYNHGKNNYNFIDDNSEQKQLEHNDVKQINCQLLFNHNLGKFNFNSGLWYQNQDRNVPMSSFYPVTTQSYMDRNFRGFFGISNDKLNLKLAYLNEAEKYDDVNQAYGELHSLYKVNTFKANLYYNTDLNPSTQLSYRLNPSYSMIESSAFDVNGMPTTKNITEAIQQINLNHSINENWKLEGGIKTVLHTQFNNILLPYAGLTYKINQNFDVSILADLNQRNPTGNELFFKDPYAYGNLNLNPEENTQIRNIWKYGYRDANNQIKMTIEPYWIKTTNKIVWSPDSNFSYSPNNIAKSTSMGINSSIEWLTKINQDFRFRTIASFNYIDAKDDMDQALNYIPNFKSILSLGLIHNSYEISMQNNYTSKRSAGFNGELQPYIITNLKGIIKPTNSIHFSIGIDNLWNENFQEIAGSYMPLRNYFIGVQLIK